MRRLACDASASIVTVDDAGSPLDADKKTRTIAPALRRALVARDGGCRFPGCNNQHWVDAHHIEHWADGGETCRDNLSLLSSTAHHRLVHEGSFRILSGTATNPRFERPDGTSIDRPLLQVPHIGLARAHPALAPCMARPNPTTTGLSGSLRLRCGRWSRLEPLRDLPTMPKSLESPSGVCVGRLLA